MFIIVRQYLFNKHFTTPIGPFDSYEKASKFKEKHHVGDENWFIVSTILPENWLN